MKSMVYYVPVKNTNSLLEIQKKFKMLLTKCPVLNIIQEQNRVVIKMHFGEKGNTGYVKPDFVRVLSECILSKKGSPIVSDTNTLYRGKRTNATDHLQLAEDHGFTLKNTGAQILIKNESPENIVSIDIKQKYIKIAKIVKLFLETDVLIDLSHFKGHIMTGFGGALKNIGMGCATREGKLSQHSDVSPIVYPQNCVGCENCLSACPVQAISMIDKKSNIDQHKCIGCASCIAACPHQAIDVPWESGGGTIQEKMIEYAKAVLDKKQDKVIFINFVIKVTKECDCLAQDDLRIVPDIGILASLDPVSVDKASYDMVVKAAGKDIFKEVHPQRDGMKQLRYASQLGLGNMKYELYEVN